MDERTSHDDDELQDDNFEDTEFDEGDSTPAEDESDEMSGPPKKTPAEVESEAQERKWAADIAAGKRTIDDLPANLQWLRPKLEKRFPLKEDGDELDQRVKLALKSEREKEDLEILLEDIEANASDEQKERIEAERQELMDDGMSYFRATVAARKMVGLKSREEVVRERRLRGMTLSSGRTQPRKTVFGDKVTEIDKRLDSGLPPGFKP